MMIIYRLTFEIEPHNQLIFWDSFLILIIYKQILFMVEIKFSQRFRVKINLFGIYFKIDLISLPK